MSADGRNAEFLNVEGLRGQVGLFNDPNLFKILEENHIDLSVLPPNQGGDIFFQIINTLAFPVIFFAGVYLISRRMANGPGARNDPNNPFSMGKTKARI